MRSPGARSLKALGTYNFAGDLGKMAIPAAGALLVTMLPWRVTLALIGAVGLVVAVAVLLLTPRYRAETAKTEGDEGGHAVGGQGGFYALLSIGVINSATRMGLLTFLPFLLTAKGASLPTIGFALTLVFVGGAVGKLVCAWIGARIGVVATVWLTEGLTALGILALIVLPLEFALMLLPAIGVALNGTSSVLYGSVPLLVSPEARTRAFSIFYTGAIGSGAIAPIFYGLIGDAVGVPNALIVIAAIVLADVAAGSRPQGHGSPPRLPPDGFQLINPRRRKSGVLLRFCQRAGNSVRALAPHERLKRSLSWRNGGEFHGTGP